MNYVIVFCQIILVLTFYLAGYFIHMNENQSFQHSLTTAVKYGQYRQNMDSSTYLAGLIKSENLIKSNNVSMLNQSRIISLLEINIDLLGPLMQEISDSILQNEIETGNSYFDEILHQEMCNTSYGLQQKTCYPANYNLSYSSNDYIGDVVSNGILGYHSALMNYLNSEFEYEMNNLQYDTVENNQKATSTKQFNNFILGYFCDIQDLFLQILLIFQQFNQDNASALFNVLLYYYLICGITLFITFIISEIFWIKWIQRRVLKIRQILALLPLSSIENQSIKNQAKRILNQLH